MKEEKIEKHVFYVENGKLLHKTKEEYEIIEDIEVKRCESKIDIDEKRIKAIFVCLCVLFMQLFFI